MISRLILSGRQIGLNLATAVFGALLLSALAQANIIVGPKPPYTGTGDYATFTAWGGLRCYSNAVAATGTQKAITIRRASDNTTTDILCLTTGQLDVATAATFCSLTSCFATKLYDQTGNGHDWVQATTANQPQLLLSGCGFGDGTLPCLKSTTAAMILRTAANITPATAIVSFSVVGNRQSGTGTCEFMQENGVAGSNRIQTQGGVANKMQVSGGSSGSIAATANDNAWHSETGGIGSGTGNSFLTIDGVTTTGTITGSTTAATSGVAGAAASTGCLFASAGFIDNALLTASQRASLHYNNSTYWGTP